MILKKSNTMNAVKQLFLSLIYSVLVKTVTLWKHWKPCASLLKK